MRAYKQVARNDGSGGIDGMEREELRQWLGKHINTLRETLLTEKYEVSAVRKVEIQRPDGGKRILGIPTVKDRLIQQAIHQELSRYYEPVFSESSYGFRPGRSAHQAIEQASKHIQEGKEWVVDIDLEKFFDRINHDRLMQRLSKGIGDKKLLRLINAYLKAGMMDDGLTEQRVAGTPQGGPLSPLLSNIVLDELDKELESRGHSFCRYADDCNIYVKSRKAGERVMTSIVDFIEKKLKLKVNNAKSGVRHCSEVKFLGYTLLPEGGIRVADKSIDRLKDRIREITRRNRGVKFEEVIRELNATIIGWTNYFRLANIWLSSFRELDSWIRRKLRCYRLKQCGRRYTIFKLLRRLDIPEGKSWNAIMYSQGWWQMSKKAAVGQAMNLNWFAQYGLQSLYLRMKV
jgi:group II intron reverse transcriptase/maturase